MNSKYREQTCCFVGHKDIPPGEQLKILARVEHRLIPLIQQGVTYFGIGGSLGFDTLMADMLVSLKAAHPRIRIIEVLPFEGYRSKWSLEQQRHGIYGEIRSGTWCDGVQRFEFRCECLASGPTAWEIRMKRPLPNTAEAILFYLSSKTGNAACRRSSGTRIVLSL